MTKINKAIVLSSILILAILVSATTTESRGLAVGPNIINMENVLRNATYYQTIFIYNRNNFESSIELNASGETESWINFFEYSDLSKPIDKLVIDKLDDKQIMCKIQIPDDIENDIYYGQITASAKPTNFDVSQVNFSRVEIAIPIDVMLNITGDQDLNITVNKVQIDEVELNQNQRISILFNNNGNVATHSDINILIKKDGHYIDSIIQKTSLIQPQTTYKHNIFWNTTGKIAGLYNAYFNITVDKTPIYLENRSLKIYPPGTFTRSGILKNIEIINDIKIDNILKIESLFINEGDIHLNAKFIGEVYKDNTLIATLESAEIYVQKYHECRFLTYFTTNEPGEYEISGYVLYDGIKTPTIKSSFTINDVPYIFIFLSIIISLSLILLYIVVKNKKINNLNFLKIFSIKKYNFFSYDMLKSKDTSKHQMRDNAKNKNKHFSQMEDIEKLIDKM